MDLVLFEDNVSNYKLMHKWCSQSFIYEWFEQRVLSYEEIVKKYQDKLNSGKQELFFIKYLDKKIGFVQIYKYEDVINNYNNIYEYDLFIGEQSLLDKGLGVEIVNLVNKYIIDNYKVDAIVLRPFKRNIRAIKCYEKCGFNKINEYVDKNTIGDNEIIDVYIKKC